MSAIAVNETGGLPATIQPEEWASALVERVPAYEPKDPEILKTTKSITVIFSDDDRTLALQYAGNLAAERKDAEAHYAPYNRAANDLRNKLAALRDGVLDIFQGEVSRLKRLVMDFDQEQARKRREEEARLAREARERAEAERKRLEAEAEAQAARLQAEGKTEEASEVIEQAIIEAETITPEPIIIPEAYATAPASVTGASARKTYEAEYGDIRELIAAAAQNPDAFAQYLDFNSKAINATVRAQGERCRIPGVRVIAKQGLAIRASR